MARKKGLSKSGRDIARRLQARQRLRAWYASPLGRTLLACEQAELDRVLPNLFGFYLVQVGAVMDEYLLGSSKVRLQVVLDRDWPVARTTPLPGPVLGVYAHGGMLPVQSDSIDVVVLPHTLEFEPEPHETLREVERILVAEGHVVILGFNPWSIWGLWRLVRWKRKEHPPWSGTFRGILRIKDWLALLGFDVVLSRSAFFRPPLHHAGMMRRLLWLERLGTRFWPYLGGVYIIVARKRVVTLTPIRPRWRPRRSLLPDAKPTTFKIHE
jgi:SAM-dependent methyltransferase